MSLHSSPQFFDLTQTLREGIPDWNGCCGFKMQQVVDYVDGARVHQMEMPNGIGTHMDAPSHFIKDGLAIDDVALAQLIGPGVVIRVADRAHADYAISVEDLIQFENTHGLIPENSIVVADTGWSARWHSPEQYRNVDAAGRVHCPRFSVEAMDYLLNKNVNGLAIDTLSPDGSDYTFPVHHRWLGAGKFIIENIKVPAELPAAGFTVIALPLKIAHATESPCRVVAVIDCISGN